MFARTSHSSIEPELLAARKAISREIRLPSGPLGSADLLHRRRYPRAFAGWQDRGWSCLWPVEAHHQINRTVGRGQPVGFLVRARRIFRDGPACALFQRHLGKSIKRDGTRAAAQRIASHRCQWDSVRSNVGEYVLGQNLHLAVGACRRQVRRLQPGGRLVYRLS